MQRAPGSPGPPEWEVGKPAEKATKCLRPLLPGKVWERPLITHWCTLHGGVPRPATGPRGDTGWELSEQKLVPVSCVILWSPETAILLSNCYLDIIEVSWVELCPTEEYVKS